MNNEEILDRTFWKLVGLFFLFQFVFANVGGFSISFFLGFFGLVGLVPLLGFVFGCVFVYIGGKFAANIVSKRFIISQRKFNSALTFYVVGIAVVALFCNYVLAASIAVETGLFSYFLYKNYVGAIKINAGPMDVDAAKA